jgi:hypothetical protein
MEAKFSTLRKLFFAALAGIIPMIASFVVQSEGIRVFFVILSILLISPVLFYLVVFTLWHWKGRYIGGHSNLWGALLLIETSGWMKLVYFVRHMLPDLRGEGRYTVRAATE